MAGSPTNPDKEPDHDDANAQTGSGTGGPGHAGYEGATTVGDEGAVDLDEARRAVEEDPGADPAAGARR